MTNRQDGDAPSLLMPSEAAELLRVSTKTLSRWVEAGHLQVVPLPSGHRRYRRAEILALAEGVPS